MVSPYEYDKGDPPRDPVIQQWFQPLGDPPASQEPPGARLRMLAQVDQRRRSLWTQTWLSALGWPAIVAGFAIGVLLTASLNWWRGHPDTGIGGSMTAPVVAALTEPAPAPSPLSIYRFQTQMQDATELGKRAAVRRLESVPLPIIGFAPQISVTAHVRIGQRYADALAALQNETVEPAKQHLAWLIEALMDVQAPAPLTHYLDAILQHLQTQPGQIDSRRLWLAGFEPIYQDAYGGGHDTAWRLFTFGAQLENLYLAAATGDVQGVTYGRQLPEIHQGVSLLNLTLEHSTPFAQFQALIKKPELGTHDMGLIQNQIQTIQDILKMRW